MAAKSCSSDSCAGQRADPHPAEAHSTPGLSRGGTEATQTGAPGTMQNAPWATPGQQMPSGQCREARLWTAGLPAPGRLWAVEHPTGRGVQAERGEPWEGRPPASVGSARICSLDCPPPREAGRPPWEWALPVLTTVGSGPRGPRHSAPAAAGAQASPEPPSLPHTWSPGLSRTWGPGMVDVQPCP